MRALRSAALGCLPALLVLWGAALPATAATRSVPSAAYPTIQSAVNAAIPGDTVAIALGEYRENVSIPAGKPGIRISGVCANPAGVIVDGTVATVNGNVFDVQAAQTYFLCLTVRNGSRGISNDGDDLTVNKVGFFHNGSTGLHNTGLRAQILYNTFTGVRGNAIYTAGNNGLIKGNVIKYVHSDCIHLDFAEHTIVEGNTIGLCDGSGILSKGLGQNFTNNVIDATNNVAISASGADDSLITLNKITNTRNAGIYFSGERGRLTSNQIEASYNEGIYLDGNDAQVKSNIVKIAGLGGGEYACISINGNRPLVESNNASVCGYTGIETRGQDPIVKSNRVERLNGGGLGIDVFCHQGTTSGRVELNFATASNGYSGIFVYCPAVPGFVVFKNTANYNAGYGFELSLDDSIVNQNIGTFNGSFRQNGFYIYGSRNTITYNIADDNIEDGYYLCGESNVLHFNQARRNQDDGIIIDCGANNSMDNSVIQSNQGEGIVLRTSPNTLFSNFSLGNRRVRNWSGGDCTSDFGGPQTLTGNTCSDGSNFLVPSDLEN